MSQMWAAKRFHLTYVSRCSAQHRVVQGGAWPESPKVDNRLSFFLDGALPVPSPAEFAIEGTDRSVIFRPLCKVLTPFSGSDYQSSAADISISVQNQSVCKTCWVNTPQFKVIRITICCLT